MPCMDGGPSYPVVEVHRDEYKAMCKLLCSLFKRGSISVPPELHNWWEEHKRIDADRIRREKAETKRQVHAQAGLSKLTKEEKKAIRAGDIGHPTISIGVDNTLRWREDSWLASCPRRLAEAREKLKLTRTIDQTKLSLNTEEIEGHLQRQRLEEIG